MRSYKLVVVEEPEGTTQWRRCQAVLPGSTQETIRYCPWRGSVELNQDYLYVCRMHARVYLTKGLHTFT